MRLYVLVRTDLGGSSPAVQAGHAVAEFMRLHPNTWENQTLVYLDVGCLNGIKTLEKWEYLLQDKYLLAKFCEPDLNYELTAIAVLDADRLVKRLPLLE